MRILVTGGAGFIGSHTLKALKDYDVCAVDCHAINLEQLDFKNKVLCDIGSYSQLVGVFAAFKPDKVIHLAAQSSVAVSMKNWRMDAMENIIATINLIQVCKEYGVLKIVYAGSAGTYYGDPHKTIEEGMSPNPMSPYGISKMCAEYYIKISGIPYCILRYPNVYGEGQKAGESGVIPIFIDNIKQGKPCIVYGDCTRDYVHVSDIARANEKALNAEGEFNLGSGIRSVTSYIYKIIAHELKCDREFIMSDYRIGEVKDVRINPSKANQELKWHPTVRIEEGIKRTIARIGQTDKLPVSYAGGVGSTPASATKEGNHAL